MTDDRHRLSDEELDEIFALRERAELPAASRPDFCGQFHDVARRWPTKIKYFEIVQLAQWAVEFCEEHDIEPSQITLEDLAHGD